MESLFDRGGLYRTPGGAARTLGRLSPEAWFYARLHYHVYLAGRRAKKKTLTPEYLYAQSRKIMHALEETGAGVEITGGEHLRALDGPCVFIANHMSSLETIVLPAILLPHTRVSFVVIEKLLRYPLLGDILRHTRAIPVGQADAAADLRAVFREGGELLGGGTSVVVFPEGGRQTSFSSAKFNSLGIKLARKHGVPVMPLALRTDAWGQGRLMSDYGRVNPALPVRFAFGPRMAVVGRGVEEHRACIEFVAGALSGWGVKVA